MQDLIGFTWTGDDGRKATVTGRWELGDSYVTIRYDDGDTAIRPIGVVRAYKRIKEEPLDTVSQADRLKALKELCEKHYLDPNDQNTAAEDIAPYLDGEEEINEWAAVTRNNDITYVYPIFDNAEDAKDRATEHIIDDIYSEQPVEVVNLDTGERLSPAWYTMEWVGTKETKELDRQIG